MDGEYQCNRNRHNLQIPDGTTSRRSTEINFQVRQQEIMLTDGSIWAKPWRFEKISILPNNAQETGHRAPYDGEYVGMIEVVVLRCNSASQGFTAGPDTAPFTKAVSSKSKLHRKKADIEGTLDKAAKLIDARNPGRSTMLRRSFDGTNETDSERVGGSVQGADGQWGKLDDAYAHKSNDWGFEMTKSNTGICKPVQKKAPPQGQKGHRHGATRHDFHQASNQVDEIRGASRQSARGISPAVVINITHPTPRELGRKRPALFPRADRGISRNPRYVTSQTMGRIDEILSNGSYNDNDNNKRRYRTLSSAEVTKSWNGSHQESQESRENPGSGDSEGQHQQSAPNDEWNAWPESAQEIEERDSMADWVNSVAVEYNATGNRGFHDSSDTVEERSRTNHSDNPVGFDRRTSSWVEGERTRRNISSDKKEGLDWDNHSRSTQCGDSWTQVGKQWSARGQSATTDPRCGSNPTAISGSVISGAWPKAPPASIPTSPAQYSYSFRQDKKKPPVSWGGQRSWDDPVPFFSSPRTALAANPKTHNWLSQNDASRIPVATENTVGKKFSSAAQGQVPDTAHNSFIARTPTLQLNQEHLKISRSKARLESTLIDRPIFDPRDKESPLYTIAEEVARRRNVSHQVHQGRPEQYHHKMATPVYMDSHESPYAVFVFQYRSQSVIEQMLNINAQEPEEQEKERLKVFTKDEIIDHYIREKSLRVRRRATSNGNCYLPLGVDWDVPAQDHGNGNQSQLDIDMSPESERLNRLQTDSTSGRQPVVDRWGKSPERTVNIEDNCDTEKENAWGGWRDAREQNSNSAGVAKTKAPGNWVDEGGDHWNRTAVAQNNGDGDANRAWGGDNGGKQRHSSGSNARTFGGASRVGAGDARHNDGHHMEARNNEIPWGVQGGRHSWNGSPPARDADRQRRQIDASQAEDVEW